MGQQCSHIRGGFCAWQPQMQLADMVIQFLCGDLDPGRERGWLAQVLLSPKPLLNTSRKQQSV